MVWPQQYSHTTELTVCKGRPFTGQAAQGGFLLCLYENHHPSWWNLARRFNLLQCHGLLRSLAEVRDLVDDTCGGPSPGQPFYLDHIYKMATWASDPDAEYCNILQQGVPLGVDTAPRENYSSAELHSEEIRKTFLEDKELDMVLGPFTASEAASCCQCQVSELCPGPMAAMDEGDKIRTIYDGSWGGAHAHIQTNCAERTATPTVMDCLHGIHWLQAAQEEPARSKLPLGMAIQG